MILAVAIFALLIVLGVSLMSVAAEHADEPSPTIPDIVRRQQSRAMPHRRDEWIRTCFCRDGRRSDWIDEFYRVHGGE